MPKYQRPLHRRSTSDENQILPPSSEEKRASNKWRFAGLFLAAVIGGIIGYLSLPSHVTDIIDPGYSLSAEGVRLFTVGGGSLASLILAIWLGVVVAGKDKRKPRSMRVWLCIGICTVALISAILGYAYLPVYLITPIRIFGGIIIGLIGLAILVEFITNPQAALEGVAEGCIGGCMEGCFSLAFVLLLAVAGLIGGGLLMWHMLL